MSNDIVLSLPHIFRRSPTLKRDENSIVMKQKLNTKMYLGVNMKSGFSSGVKIREIVTFDSSSGEYSKDKFSEIISDDRVLLLESIASKYLKDFGCDNGIEVSILSEHMRGYGFGFMGSFFTLLSSIIHLLSKKIAIQDIEDYATFIASDIFDSIVNLSLKMDIERSGSPLGLLPRLSLMNTSEPVIQFGTPMVKNSSGGVKEISYKTLLLSELTGSTSEEVGKMPIDFGIISFGVAYNAGEVRRKYDYFKKFYSETFDFFCVLKDKFELPGEVSDSKHDGGISSISRFFWLNVMKYIDRMLRNPGESHYVDALIQSIVDSGIHDSLLDRERYNLLDTYYWFNKLKKFAKEKIGLIPISTSKVGGTFLFVCHRNQSRDTLDLLIKKLKEEGYSGINYQYLSWRDGLCSEGLKVHQNISEGVYSDYVKKGSVLFIAAQGSRYVGNHTEILTNEKKGLILDSIHGKIYMHGKKLTHKHLRSQSATVEILDILLKNKGKYVHNSMFPVSSYSKNKNEMIGKIIIPLKELVKEYLNDEIKIECKGSIFDFHVILQDDVGVINRLVSLGS